MEDQHKDDHAGYASECKPFPPRLDAVILSPSLRRELNCALSAHWPLTSYGASDAPVDAGSFSAYERVALREGKVGAVGASPIIFGVLAGGLTLLLALQV